jgi:hypothetical protein
MDQAVLQGTLQGSTTVGEKRSNAESAGSQISRRRINALVTTNCTTHTWNISRIAYKQYQNYDNVVSETCELDSHADTCVTGANCVAIEETHQTVDMSGFSDSLDTLRSVPIMSAAMAYDDPADGTTYILILGQAIYMGDKMQHSLICPNQLRARGLIVEDCLQLLSPRDRPSSHSIYEPDEDIRLPLSLKGVTSYFTTRTPTTYEIKTCKWITLFNEQNWDPHSEEFQEHEENYVWFVQQGRDFGPEQDRNLFQVTSRSNIPRMDYSTVMSQVSHAFDDKYILSIALTITSGRNSFSAENLASAWGIGIDLGGKTLKCTTQKGTRATLHPIERRLECGKHNSVIVS